MNGDIKYDGKFHELRKNAASAEKWCSSGFDAPATLTSYSSVRPMPCTLATGFINARRFLVLGQGRDS
jgi:hypothetical protein